jgi:hypothetical protein
MEGSIEPSVHLAKLKAAGKLKLNFATDEVGSRKGTSLSDALLEVSKKTGRDIVFIVDEVQEMVTPREVQSAIDVLKASNLVMRNGDRGPVTVTDPFVRDSWLRLHTRAESVVDQSSMLEATTTKSSPVSHSSPRRRIRPLKASR